MHKKLREIIDILPEEITIVGACFGLDAQDVYDSLIELRYLQATHEGVIDGQHAYVSEVNGWLCEEVLNEFSRAHLPPPSGYYIRELGAELIANLTAKSLKRYGRSQSFLPYQIREGVR